MWTWVRPPGFFYYSNSRPTLGSFCFLSNKLSYENWPGLGSLRNFVRWLGHFSWYDHFTSCLCCPSLIFYQGYLPLPTRLRSSTLERKRGEYQSLVDLTFAKGKDGLDQQIWHQIEIDVPRTRPGVQLWMQGSTQRVWPRHIN